MHLFKRIVTKSELGSKLGLSPPSETWTIPNSPVPYHRPSAKYDRLNDDETDNLPFFTRPAVRSGSTSSSPSSPIPAVSSSFVFDSIDDAGCFDLWNSLPYELKFEVLKHVSLKDVAALSISCRLIHQLTNENALWKHWTCVNLELSLETMQRFGSQIQDWRSYSKFQVCFYKKGCIQSQKVTPTSIARPQPRFAQTACVVDDKIYYVGGQMADKRSDEILTYQPSKGEFEKVNISNYDPTADTMPTKEQVSADCKNFKGIAGKVPNFARHQSVQVNGKIYVFGGYDYTFFYNLALFDPAQRTWTYPDVFGDVPAPRSNHSSCVVGNKFYIFGGSVGDNVDKYSVTNDFYCFDTITMKWTRLSSDPSSEEPSSQKNISIMQPSGRVGHVMSAVGDFIYLFGGGVWGKVSGWTQQYNDLFIYDTKTNQWEAVTMKNEEKPGVCTYPYVFTVGHNVMIFGGASMTGSTVTNKMYGWDILARKWREMHVEGEEISARSIGTANLVGNEIILWGGYCGGLLAADNDMFKLKLSKM